MGRRGAVIVAALVALLAAAPAGANTIPTNVPVAMHAHIGPSKLPADHPAPAVLQLGDKFSTAPERQAPIMAGFEIELGPTVYLEDEGLALCSRADLAGAGTRSAMGACGAALVGHGNFVFGSEGGAREVGRVLAFNGRIAGRPAILARVDVEHAALSPSRFTIAFESSKQPGRPGTSLIANLPPHAMTDGRHLVAFDLSLQRNYSSAGRRRGFIEASCPAAPGEITEMSIGTVVFSFAELPQIVERPREGCRATH